MAGLTVHNFLSAATGIALAVALTRGLRRAGGEDARQFLGRSDPHHALRPAAARDRRRPRLRRAGRAADPARPRSTRRRSRARKQTIALGPVASQEAIKQLGTNGGGFFNANSAHPFENPTPSPTSSRSVACSSIPAALRLHLRARWSATSGRAARSSSRWAFMLVAGVGRRLLRPRRRQSAAGTALGLDPATGNMEGKEVRFGVADVRALGGRRPPAPPTARVNAMHDSFTPLGGAGAAVHDPARRDHARRRRLGPLRHAGVWRSSPSSSPG